MSDLPAKWATVGLLEISDLVRGVTYAKADACDVAFEGSIPVLRANNIQDRAFDLSDLIHVPSSVVSNAQRVCRGDVVVATSSGSVSVVGKAAQALHDMNAGFGAFCGLLRPSNKIDAKYFGHYFSSHAYRTAVSAMARGVNINNLKRDHFQVLEFPLAPLNEQKRIADKLDAVLAGVDACRGRLDRIPTILKRFRQSVLAAATSGKLTEDWRIEHAVVDEWQLVNVQTVAHVGTGATPLRSNPAFFASVGTPWITSAATSQSLVTTAEEFVTAEAISAHRLKSYPVGTLLVAMYGEGKTRGQVTELGISATINQACAAVVVDESKAKRTYVKLALQANYFEMRELAEGGNQPNLNLSKVKEFPLSLPHLDEQAEIVRRVEALFAFADRLEARYTAARAQVEKLTPATLAKAFRGELVPQDPDDEPASELLERIRAQRSDQAGSKPARSRKLRTNESVS